MSTGKITIRRSHQWANKMRDLGILLNGKKAGIVGEGKELTIPCEVGDFKIAAIIDWCKTIDQDGTIAEGEELFYELGSNITGWRSLFVVYYLIFEPKNYLYLKQVK